MRVCSICGETNEDWMNICQRCGNSINNADEYPDPENQQYKYVSKSKRNQEVINEYNVNNDYGYDNNNDKNVNYNVNVNVDDDKKKRSTENMDLKLILLISIIVLVLLLCYTFFVLVNG